jgi:hypothetical protein
MEKMTLQKRYEDIAERSGLSENVVKRVLSAQADSVIASLKRGETATVPQLVVIKPSISRCFKRGTLIETDYIKVKPAALESLKQKMEKEAGFTEEEEDEYTEDENIRVAQIGSLM